MFLCFTVSFVTAVHILCAERENSDGSLWNAHSVEGRASTEVRFRSSQCDCSCQPCSLASCPSLDSPFVSPLSPSSSSTVSHSQTNTALKASLPCCRGERALLSLGRKRLFAFLSLITNVERNFRYLLLFRCLFCLLFFVILIFVTSYGPISKER